MSRFKFKPLTIGVLLVLIVYTYFFSQLHILNGFEYMSFQKLVRGRADTPFQYRFLVPWMGRITYYYLEHYNLIEELDEVKAIFEYSFVFVLLCAFIYAAPYLVLNDPNTNEKRDFLIRVISGSLLMFALPFHFILPARVYYYPYDIPSILFFILGLTFLRLKKWWLFLLIFAIGTFNRETTIFLPFIYLLTNWKHTHRSKLVIYFLLQIFVWVIIKFLLWQAFKDNTIETVGYTDTIFKNTLDDNLELLTRPKAYLRLFTVYGYLWLPLLLLWKNIRDQWIKSALLIVPCFHLAMLIPGDVGELRIYGEMLPLIIMGIVAGLIANERWNQFTEKIPWKQPTSALSS